MKTPRIVSISCFIALTAIAALLTPATALTTQAVPLVKFKELYGGTNRLGTFPVFQFTMTGGELSLMKPFLYKDSKFIGEIAYTMGFDNRSRKGVVNWEVGGYLSNRVIFLPQPGSGYTVKLGILKDPTSVRSGGPLPEDFRAADETDQFVLTPSAPFIFRSVDRGADLKYQATMYIVGKIGSSYVISRTTDLGAGWTVIGRITTAFEVVRVVVNLPAEIPTVGLFRLEGSIGLTATRKNLQEEQEVTFNFTPTEPNR